MIVLFDSHAHVNTTDTGKYPVAPLSGSLAPTALADAWPAERLIAAMDGTGVSRAVVVQRAHVYGFDNSYCLDAAAAFPDRLRALCVIDGRSDGAADATRHCLDRGALGIRFTEPEKGAGLDWLNSDGALAAWRLAVDRGASIRVHMYRWNRIEALAALLDIVRRFPQTTLVLDHLSNLAPESGPDFGIDEPLRRLMEHRGTHLMFSMINLGRWERDGVNAAPVIRRVVSEFGADRVMWGSDVGNTPGRYDTMIEKAWAAASLLSKDERVAVFQTTATRVYGW